MESREITPEEAREMGFCRGLADYAEKHGHKLVLFSTRLRITPEVMEKVRSPKGVFFERLGRYS